MTLQKRAMRTRSFSETAGEHSEALLRELILLPFHNALLVHHYYYNLPAIFIFKMSFKQLHMYTHTIPGLLLNQPIKSIPINTNYGKFNIRFAAVKVWNHLDESIKQLPLKTFITKSTLTSYSLTVHESSLAF